MNKEQRTRAKNGGWKYKVWMKNRGEKKLETGAIV